MAASPIPLEPVNAVSITTLVDSVYDMLAQDQGPAKRLGLPGGNFPRVPAAFLEGGQAFDSPLAEHGFSMLVTVHKDGRDRRVLFDAGVTANGVVQNMRRLGLSPKDIEAIVLSHGHFDHTTGLDGLVRALGRANLPVVLHPEFWTKRRISIPGRDPFELPSTSRSALLGAGFDILEERQPSFLLDRSVLVTGEVDRTTEFERGFPVHQALRNGSWQPDPLVLDDQAILLNVLGKGLVVMTGCGHAGIVNILRYARELTGHEQIYAVIGGFHLAGPMFEPIIPDVCEAFAELAPQVIVPAHCTGWRATLTLATIFGDAVIPNSVGTRFEL